MSQILFEETLIQGRLQRRYKRFLADIELEDGQVVTAHCANPGSMRGLTEEGARVGLLANTNPKAKLNWRWEMIEIGGTFVGINTNRANPLIEQALKAQSLEMPISYDTVWAEVPYGTNSRVDFLLEGAADPKGVKTYVEVKSVTLKEDDLALFPDSVTVRGTKHLNELSACVEAGHRAVMVYLVQRDDCQGFDVADHIDPKYGAALDRAIAKGVDVIAVEAHVSLNGYRLKGTIPFVRPSVSL